MSPKSKGTCVHYSEFTYNEINSKWLVNFLFHLRLESTLTHTQCGKSCRNMHLIKNCFLK